jgi:hypothetical protein
MILVTMLCLVGVNHQAQAQQPASGSSKPDSSADVVDRVNLSNLIARVSRGRHPSFSLMPSSSYARVTGMFGATSSPPAVLGTGTIGKISMWTGVSPSGNPILGDSIITQLNGNIGIGLATPISKLSVEGMIETTLGGYKFPDGTVQTTAAVSGLQSVFHDATLTGDGTAGSPLRVAVPLDLSGTSTTFPILTLRNNGNGGGHGLISFGASASSRGGDGVQGVGGGSASGFGGIGVNGLGGHSPNGQGGIGLVAQGGPTDSGRGGFGLDARGGTSNQSGEGGVGIIATGGFSVSGAAGIGAIVRGGRSLVDNAAGGIGVEATGGFSGGGDGGVGVSAHGGNVAFGGTGGAGMFGGGGNSIDSSAGIGGVGVVGSGGNSQSGGGGIGVTASGGNGETAAGLGLYAIGGFSNSGFGGDAVHAFGGAGNNLGGAAVVATGGSFGGIGVKAIGGASNNPSFRGGPGIFAIGGDAAPGGERGVAGLFAGNVEINGDLNLTGAAGCCNLNVQGTKNFKIDHPLDPENKYLLHASVESSEVLNVYSGNVVTDANGEATVTLPDWFETLNRDLRYQLTIIGTFAQAIVAREVRDNRFTIKTTAPSVKVSWQVTGVRSDRAMKKQPFKAEEDKPDRERGHYLQPELYGQPEERSVEWSRNPELMGRLRKQAERQSKNIGRLVR